MPTRTQQETFGGHRTAPRCQGLRKGALTVQFLQRAIVIAILATPGVVLAQAKQNKFGAEADDHKGPKLGQAAVERWRVGVIINALSGIATDISGCVQLPVEWPEQQVKVLEEEFTPFASEVRYRNVEAVKEFLIAIPQVPAGQEAKMLVTLQITRFAQLPPDDTTVLMKLDSKKLPKDIRRYLGPSPRIESQGGKIKVLAKKIAKEAEGKTDWEQIEAIFNWVRENVMHEAGAKQPGALQALRDKTSDHEGLTSLFVGLCRASDVPARTVWIPKSSYPEFYLTDDEGEGHWYPCRLMEPCLFGGTSDVGPIWQKGDNFRSPDAPREALRYLPSKLSANTNKPQVTFIRELVSVGAQ
jgi:hypothetical protein